MLIDDLIGRARRHWLFIAVGIVLGGVAGYASTWTKTPLYQAETVVAPANTRNAATGLAQLLQPLQGAARTLSLGDDAADLSRGDVQLTGQLDLADSWLSGMVRSPQDQEFASDQSMRLQCLVEAGLPAPGTLDQGTPGKNPVIDAAMGGVGTGVVHAGASTEIVPPPETE